jgi:hypothetical protein
METAPPMTLKGHPSHDVIKKRPLSISSTTSSNSSTSSLPRHQHKRFAMVHDDAKHSSSQSDCDSKSSSLDRDQDLDSAFCSPGVALECPSSAEEATPLSYIDKVVAEIIHTERTYVKDLSDIIQVKFLAEFLPCAATVIACKYNNDSTLRGLKSRAFVT